MRVALGTGYNPGEGNRRASRVSGVSSPPTRIPTLGNTATHTHTPTHNARTLTNQHGSHWQRRRNDATELAHADMTALPKTDTNYTALSDASNNW